MRWFVMLDTSYYPEVENEWDYEEERYLPIEAETAQGALDVVLGEYGTHVSERFIVCPFDTAIVIGPPS
jgi:hypothetical protein